MDFVALVDQVIALLRQRGRVTYRTQRQFQLDADALADLPAQLRYAHPEALREDEQGSSSGRTRLARRPQPRPARGVGSPGPTDVHSAYLAGANPDSRSALKANASRSPSCLPTSRVPPS